MRPRLWGTDYPGGGVCGKQGGWACGWGEAIEGVYQRYKTDASVSELVASRDLKKLWDLGMFELQGEKRSVGNKIAYVQFRCCIQTLSHRLCIFSNRPLDHL
jgi:hypothetical protein